MLRLFFCCAAASALTIAAIIWLAVVTPPW